jgi:YHS domain-containing protein
MVQLCVFNVKVAMRTIYTILLCFWVFAAHSQTLQQRQFNVKDNIALEGYDPVSYFDGKPEEGKSELKVTHKGVVYLFVSQANQNKFKASPDKYEPAYGGWCAYAMGATGEKVKIDPETYKILDGKVYLFYNFWGNNTLSDWKKEERKLKEAADRNWSKYVP